MMSDEFTSTAKHLAPLPPHRYRTIQAGRQGKGYVAKRDFVSRVEKLRF